MEKIDFNPRWLGVVLVAAATFYFLFLVRQVLITFVVGAALAYILYPAARALEARGLHRGLAVLLLYLVIGSAAGGLVWYTVPRLAAEMKDLAGTIPGYVDGAETMILQVKNVELPASLDGVMRVGIEQAEQAAYKALKNFLDSLVGALGSLIALVFSPILAYYFVTDWERIKQGIVSILPAGQRTRASRLGKELDSVLSGFIQGHLLVCLLVGATSGLAAALLGIRYSLVIGLITGITELFPYFGPMLGAVPALILALTEGPRTALFMGIALLLMQQLEANVFSPRIVGDRVGMHPLVVILALLAGGELLGIWGMLLAVPAAAVLKVAASFVFNQVID